MGHMERCVGPNKVTKILQEIYGRVCAMHSSARADETKEIHM